MIKQVVILCGGKGTRLAPLTKDSPKPLLPLAGKVLLDRTIEMLVAQGFTDFLLLAGHLGDQIVDHYEQSGIEGAKVEVFIEPVPLGTAGALPLVEEKLDEAFLLVYGDIFVDFNARRLADFHEKEGEGVVASLLIRQSDHPWDSHLVDVDENGEVREFIFQQEEGKLYKNFGNVAIYACSKKILDYIPLNEPSDYGRNIFPLILSQKGRVRALELEVGGFVRDMGTPDRLTLVENYLKRKERALIARENPKPLKVAFLDRDGTLNYERGLISSPDQIEMIPGSADAVAQLCKAGWKCYIITNQPVIARGLCDFETLEQINQKVVSAIEEEGGKVEKVFYSPYHPETHHGDGVKKYRRASDCRKPGSGMLYQAEEGNGLDLAEVIMIGDTWRDIVAGQGAGVRTCFLGEQKEGQELGAEYTASSLEEFAKNLIQ